MLSMTSWSLRSCSAKACFLVRSLLVVRLSILSVTCFDRKTCLRSRIESVKSRFHTSKRWVQSSTAGARGRRVGPSRVWFGALAVSYPFFSRLWQTATESKTGSFSTEQIGLTSNEWRRGTLDYTGWFGIGSAEGWAFGQSTGWILNHSMMHQCNISYIRSIQKWALKFVTGSPSTPLGVSTWCWEPIVDHLFVLFEHLKNDDMRRTEGAVRCFWTNEVRHAFWLPGQVHFCRSFCLLGRDVYGCQFHFFSPNM